MLGTTTAGTAMSPTKRGGACRASRVRSAPVSPERRRRTASHFVPPHALPRARVRPIKRQHFKTTSLTRLDLAIGNDCDPGFRCTPARWALELPLGVASK